MCTKAEDVQEILAKYSITNKQYARPIKKKQNKKLFYGHYVSMS